MVKEIPIVENKCAWSRKGASHKMKNILISKLKLNFFVSY